MTEQQSILFYHDGEGAVQRHLYLETGGNTLDITYLVSINWYVLPDAINLLLEDANKQLGISRDQIQTDLKKNKRVAWTPSPDFSILAQNLNKDTI